MGAVHKRGLHRKKKTESGKLLCSQKASEHDSKQAKQTDRPAWCYWIVESSDRDTQVLELSSSFSFRFLVSRVFLVSWRKKPDSGDGRSPSYYL